MDDKKKKSIPTWVWITLAAIALVIVILIWFIQNLISFFYVMVFLGGAAEGTAESIFPLRDN